MKKTEFLERLGQELEKRNVADPADIVEEYEQHFAMKMADGYAEEEIAARLGSPASLAAVGCVYYGAFLRQLVRSYGRFCHNTLAVASGGTALPALAINPQFSGKTKRRLRTAALVALALFAACFVLFYVVCALSAGSFQFWHVWGWFVK